jgi:uncharacterized Ntn-hydrolase superfamily protein
VFRISFACEVRLTSEANTFSIIARCPRSGQIGVSVASAVPAVGSMCPFIRSGIGAVSTQSWVNPYLALTALTQLEKGVGAVEALAAALAEDEAGAFRQFGIVDASGGSAAHTGKACTPWAGQILGPGVAIVGNMLTGPEVLDAMITAFDASASADLAERLMLALEAGDAAGGDMRGKQSAALRIHADEVYALLDIRVDEHAEPVAELRRVLGIARAQLIPFVVGMPKRGKPAEPAPREVTEMLLRSPPDRPQGGGSRRREMQGRIGMDELQKLIEVLGIELSSERRAAVLAAFQPVAEEIAKLRGLDLTDIHPAVVFSPIPENDKS